MTIDTLKYCIDTGYEKVNTHDPLYNASMLTVQPVSQASAIQRRGRVGRRAVGEWYPAFTEESFKELQADPWPSIVRMDISKEMLMLIIRTVYP